MRLALVWFLMWALWLHPRWEVREERNGGRGKRWSRLDNGKKWLGFPKLAIADADAEAARIKVPVRIDVMCSAPGKWVKAPT